MKYAVLKITIVTFFFSIALNATEDKANALSKKTIVSKKSNSKSVKKSKSKRKRSKKSRSKKLANLIMDADFSLNRGDAYRALKLYEYVRLKSKKRFYSKEVYPKYLKTLSLLGSTKGLIAECNTKVGVKSAVDFKNYSCAFSYYKSGLYRRALRVLTRSNFDEKASTPKLLKASIYLALNSPKKCVNEVAKAKVPSKYLDLKSLTVARCEMARRNYALAINYYKNVSSESKHYMDALYEMAWAQFKDRSIGDTKTTIDVLLSSYSDFADDRAEISQKEYFNLRYLRAYLGVVQNGASDVGSEMSLALGDLDLAKKRAKLKQSDISKIVKSLSKANGSWKDLAKSNSNFKELVIFLENWGSHYENRKLLNKLRYFLALSFERKRLKIFSDKIYVANIKKIHDFEKPRITKELTEAYSRTQEAMSGFELRIQLAKHKTNVLQATKGVRSLEQAKEIYADKENYLNQMVGGVE